MARSEPSLFLRLIALMSLVLAIGAAALMAAAWYSSRQAADEAYDKLLLGAALQIADAITIQNGKAEIELPVSAFELLSLSELDRIFYRVLDPAGVTMTGYEDLADPQSIDGKAGAGELIVNGTYQGEAVRIARISRTFDDAQLRGQAIVIVAQTVGARAVLARQLTLRSLFLVAMMSLIAIAGMVFAVRHALAPIGRLQAAISQRDPFDLSRIETPAPRELAPFVSEINGFVERLRSRIELMQEFIANAAHQLRTPITALNGQVELLSDLKVGPEARQRLDRVTVQAETLARLANQLLSHAMVTHRERLVASSSIDLTQIVRRAVDEAVPDTGRDILVTLYPPAEPLVISGDPVNIGEAIKNIIDNAVRHGSRSALQVRMSKKDGFAVVEIEDDGPGIPVEKWPLATRRFGLPSADAGGSGLGLSIAAEVAMAHGGNISFHNAPSGFVVSLSFAIDPQQETV